MRKVKLIVHETYQEKRKSEDVFAAVFLSNAAALTPNTHSGIHIQIYSDGTVYDGRPEVDTLSRIIGEIGYD